MINTGDKNVNVVEIINKLSGKHLPTNEGIDDYVVKEDVVEYPRDVREHNPINVINSPQIKPQDDENLLSRVLKLENAVKNLTK